MINKLKTNKGEFLFVEIPEDATSVSVVKNILGAKYSLKYKVQTGLSSFKVSYKGVSDYNQVVVVGISNDISEECAGQIVDDNGMGCWDNYRLKKDEKYTCLTAISSLKCLMETSGLSRRYAILK